MFDENNPLFDLCKIHVDLLFINENNIPNINYYENSLIFYLNKNLYKIKEENQNKNNNEKNSNFYYFEFNSKTLNIKSSNIPGTDLLSNTTDIFCNIVLIFDSKEKDKLKNIPQNKNFPNELTHTLIFYDKNSDIDLNENNFNNLDKSSYDLIKIWKNNNELKKIHQQLENALRKIIIKYRTFQLNKKLDICLDFFI